MKKAEASDPRGNGATMKKAEASDPHGNGITVGRRECARDVAHHEQPKHVESAAMGLIDESHRAAEAARIAENEDDNTQEGTTAEGESVAAATNGRAAATGNTGADTFVTSTTNDSDVIPIANLSSLGPGAYRISRLRFRDDGEAIVGQDIDADGQNDNADEDEVVFQGFLPEPTQEDLYRRRAEELLRSAISLEDSAVRTLVDNDDEESDDEERGESTSETKSDAASDEDLVGDKCNAFSQGGSFPKYLKSPIALILLVLLSFSAIAFGVAFWGFQGDRGEPPHLTVASCVANFQDRYDHAKSIVSSITPQETLEDATSPQKKALEWIVCQDEVSSRLIDDRDPATGLLPAQAHGTEVGGDAGESQVLRRYAIAVFFLATSELGPWTESWNFLSPDVHECAWHEKKKRNNWPYGEFDPAGFVCLSSERSASGAEANEIMLDDAEADIHQMVLNFRIPNNLTGTLPPEFGHIKDLTNITLENQKGLRGSLPSTMGNMMGLMSFSILFAGPEFGGVIPPSLFTIPAIKYITFLFNDGTWELPGSIRSTSERNLLGLTVASTGLSGTIPSFISEFQSLAELDLSENSLEGSIPESLGSLSSLDYLDLHDNDLTGTLPHLGQLRRVTAMALGKNRLRGLLPPGLGDLSTLRVLDLGYNNFEGGIPSTFSQLSNLEHVSLQHNALNGSISAFESLDSLSSLLLYSNNFDSVIPADLFSNYNGRIFADFGHNNFTGRLPQVMSGRSSNISYLAIMRNNFDSDAVDNVVCDEVATLFADCSSCPCCKLCCSGNSGGENSLPCNFDLDFYTLSGLHCGSWWKDCHDPYYDLLPVD